MTTEFGPFPPISIRHRRRSKDGHLGAAGRRGEVRRGHRPGARDSEPRCGGRRGAAGFHHLSGGVDQPAQRLGARLRRQPATCVRHGGPTRGPTSLSRPSPVVSSRAESPRAARRRSSTTAAKTSSSCSFNRPAIQETRASAKGRPRLSGPDVQQNAPSAWRSATYERGPEVESQGNYQHQPPYDDVVPTGTTSSAQAGGQANAREGYGLNHSVRRLQTSAQLVSWADGRT